jgi:hypothetical protein
LFFCKLADYDGIITFYDVMNWFQRYFLHVENWHDLLLWASARRFPFLASSTFVQYWTVSLNILIWWNGKYLPIFLKAAGQNSYCSYILEVHWPGRSFHEWHFHGHCIQHFWWRQGPSQGTRSRNSDFYLLSSWSSDYLKSNAQRNQNFMSGRGPDTFKKSLKTNSEESRFS